MGILSMLPFGTAWLSSNIRVLHSPRSSTLEIELKMGAIQTERCLKWIRGTVHVPFHGILLVRLGLKQLMIPKTSERSMEGRHNGQC